MAETKGLVQGGLDPVCCVGHSKWFRYPVRSLDVNITAGMPLDPQKMQHNLMLFGQDIRVELPTVLLIFSKCKIVNN